MKKDTLKKNKKKGISLIIALITMTLLLSLSFSIGGIILRQLKLTNINVNSQSSFYAADSALECALYWDASTDGTIGVGDFTTAIFGTTTVYTSNNPIKCGPNTSNPLSFTKTVALDIATTTFDIDYGQNTCARVQIVKNPYRTSIYTSGYNTGLNTAGDACDLNDAVQKRTVERALLFTH
jgi:Tfp pilus assembly protein PilX